jgi:hypothetical protein
MSSSKFKPPLPAGTSWDNSSPVPTTTPSRANGSSADRDIQDRLAVARRDLARRGSEPAGDVNAARKANGAA